MLMSKYGVAIAWRWGRDLATTDVQLGLVPLVWIYSHWIHFVKICRTECQQPSYLLSYLLSMYLSVYLIAHTAPGINECLSAQIASIELRNDCNYIGRK